MSAGDTIPEASEAYARVREQHADSASHIEKGVHVAETASPMVTHRLRLDLIEEACELFANERDGVLKVAVTP